MAILVQFEVKGATLARYDETIRRLTAMGLRVPAGQTYHVAYGEKDNLQVIDVFESEEQFAAFGAKLAPILQELGITAVPKVHRVHAIIIDK